MTPAGGEGSERQPAEVHSPSPFPILSRPGKVLVADLKALLALNGRITGASWPGGRSHDFCSAPVRYSTRVSATPGRAAWWVMGYHRGRSRADCVW